MTYEQWLATPGLFRVVLVELDYIDNAQTKTAYFANAPFVSKGTDVPAHTPYLDLITGGLEISRAMTEVFIGRSTSRMSDLELFSNAFTSSITDVENCQIKIYLGDKEWSKADFQLVFMGVAQDVKHERNAVRVEFKDKAQTLDKPVLNDVYTSGPSVGMLKPLCFGPCFNVTPVLIDAVDHTYQFNSLPSQALTAAKFNGDTVDSANYSVNLSQSTITFSVKPVGAITLDVQGAVVNNTYLSTASHIIDYLLANRLGETVSITGLPSYALVLYLTDNTSYSAVLDQICKSVGGYWYFNRLGTFVCKYFAGTTGTPAHTLSDDQNIEGSREHRSRLKPVQNLSIGYQKNWTVLNSVASSVFDTAPELAQQLSNEQQVVTGSNVLAGKTNTSNTLIATKADAQTELARRLAIKDKARYIVQTEQFATPFNWLLGDEIELETPARNGSYAIITRLNENLLTGINTVEFWQ